MNKITKVVCLLVFFQFSVQNCHLYKNVRVKLLALSYRDRQLAREPKNIYVYIIK